MGNPPSSSSESVQNPTQTSVVAESRWKGITKHFRRSDLKRSLWQLANSLLPYLGLWYLAYVLLDVSYLATLAVCFVAALFLIRVFIIAHDCGHGSFFNSPRANDLCGSITSVLAFIPYFAWRYDHAIHHAHSGNLDQRGMGDIKTMTVSEFRNASKWQQVWYRLYRNPLVLFGIGPLYGFLISYRFWPKGAIARVKRSVIVNNLAIAGIVALAWLTIGIKAYVLVMLPIMAIAGSMGVWMFYIQHQYEDVEWEHQEDWTYFNQAIHNASFYKLPRVIQWFTGNIGFHHVHHLDSRIPNYRLEKCHNDVEFLREVKPITLRESLRFAKYRLWDEERRKLVTFAEANL